MAECAGASTLSGMLADMLRSLAGLQLTDEDGQAHVLELRPPATDAELRQLEETLPAPLPDEMRAALAVSTGLANGPLESFSLLDLEGFGLEEAFPQAYSIAHDGYGELLGARPPPRRGRLGPGVLRLPRPAVIGYQAATIEAFLADVVAMWRPGRSSVDRMHEEEVHRIWREHPGLLTPDGAARQRRSHPGGLRGHAPGGGTDRRSPPGTIRRRFRLGALRPADRDPARWPGTSLGAHSAGAETRIAATPLRALGRLRQPCPPAWFGIRARRLE